MGRFSFGDVTRRKVITGLANLRMFKSTEHGSIDHGMVGLPGPYRRLTNANYGALPREYVVGLDTAMYVVYCYGTPIAWVTMADEATEEGRVNYMPDWQYSAATTYYQSLIADAWGSDKIHDPNREKSKRDNRGTARGRRSDVVYGRETAADAEARREARENRPVSHRTAFRDDAHRSRPTLAQSMMAAFAPSGPPAGAERETRSGGHLGGLFVPADMDGDNLPAGADVRDTQRVLTDIDKALNSTGWRPAHP